MKVLNIKSEKIKTHKWKKHDTYKECIKCHIRIHNLDKGIWVENLKQGMSEFMNMNMSIMINNGFKSDFEIIDISDTCEEHIIKNIIE